MNSNYALLKDSSLKDDEIHNMKNKFGFESRFGICLKLSNSFNLKGHLKYNYLNYQYDFQNLGQPEEALIDSSFWIINSRIKAHGIGVSMGFEQNVIKKLSIAYYFSYQKIFNKNTQSHTETNISIFMKEEDISQFVRIKSEILNSFEISYKISTQFGISIGCEYSFTEEKFFPTENYGNRYKFYTLFLYRI